MTIIICADYRNGLLFNNRRLSRDSSLCDHILAMCGEQRLWMNAYSASIFPQGAPNIHASENFMEEVKPGEYCFVENDDVSRIASQAKRLVIYRWNRTYPSDVKLPDDILAGRRKISSVDFTGNSHPCITQEVYE